VGWPKENGVKTTLTIIGAAIFAASITTAALAQVGAGVAGNANVGDNSVQSGASADVRNSDAERVQPPYTKDLNTTTLQQHTSHSDSETQSAAAKAAAASNAAGAAAHSAANSGAGSISKGN
jgi:hypothetical protein